MLRQFSAGFWMSWVSDHVAQPNSWCAYGDAHPVLREVSFEVPAGTRVGLAGATGAGKTTLLNLLIRFYDLRRCQKPQ